MEARGLELSPPPWKPANLCSLAWGCRRAVEGRWGRKGAELFVREPTR